MLRKSARLETEVVLAPLEEKEKVQPIAFGNAALLLSAKIADICFSPPGVPPLYQPDGSGSHSISAHLISVSPLKASTRFLFDVAGITRLRPFIT